MTGWRFRQSPRRGAPVSPEFPAPPVGPLVSNQLISRAHIGAPVSSWKCAAIKQKPVAEATGEKWWWVYDSNVGRQSQRIYSPPQLATLVTHRKTSHMIAHPHLPAQALFCAQHKKARGRGRTALYGLNVRTNDHARSIPAPGGPRRGTIRRARGGVGDARLGERPRSP